MNQDCDTAELVPATVKLAGPPAAPGAGVALDLPEDPLSRRASRRQGRPPAAGRGSAGRPRWSCSRR